MKIHGWIISVTLLGLLSACADLPDADRNEGRLPQIFPDYTGLVVPANIAPMNFLMKEEGEKFAVKFSGARGFSFTLRSSKGKFIIPERKWRQLLDESMNDTIAISIMALQNGMWIRYSDIRNFISADSVDPYIIYRKINPAMVRWKDMAIMQRNTESFEESAILENRNTDNNCMHCHTFQDRNPENMMLHLRTPPGGTLIKSNGKTHWLDTKTAYTVASFAYPSWHPRANLIAFSTNKIHQLMYGSGDRLNFVFDDVSDIVVYDIDKNLVFTTPALAGTGLENLPNWSPDGRSLYYINCPADRSLQQGKQAQYDLMFIPFNPETKEWGKPDTLLSSAKTGLSITFPEASPDGRYILFCMADYGYFTIGNTSSDLYLLDLKDNSYRRLDVNSPSIESFHSWSANSRWFVFASKRVDGIITLPYFSHLTADGQESKPFVLPANDPEELITRQYNYNRPVLVRGRVSMSQDEILSLISGQTEKVVFDSLGVAVDSLSGIQSATDHGEGTIYRKN
jgi:hypothetical protein